MPPTARRTTAGRARRPAASAAAVAVAALVASGAAPGAHAQSCVQRAFALLGPCEASLDALTAATSGGAVNVDAALAALGGSRAAPPAAVTQCCAALAPFNDARYVLQPCDVLDQRDTRGNRMPCCTAR